MVNNWPENWEIRGTEAGHFLGYSNRSMPSNVQNMDVEVVNYYDDYKNIPDLADNQSASFVAGTRGLLTASKVKVLGTSAYLWTVNYYDDYVHTYSFDRRPLTTKRQHVKTGAATTTISSRYEYDHVGRKIQSYQQINGGDDVLLVGDRYNAIGQLQDRAQPQFNGNISSQSWSVASVASNTFN